VILSYILGIYLAYDIDGYGAYLRNIVDTLAHLAYLAYGMVQVLVDG
jgi:hypothetical protein